jgi:two-component system, OmpR family, sensor histidine kinase QseC
VWLQVAEKDEVREEMVEQLGASVLLPLIVGGLLLVVAVNLVLSANLAPLRTLADRIAGRKPESLEPVEQAGLPEELAPVVDELNSLLLRVRQAFEREQRFIDAAAHEIRTPIAAVQLHVQNAQRAADGRERTQSLAEASAALKRTTLLAEQLLTFSRLASGTDLVRHERVSLVEICREVIALEEPLLARRGQSIGFDLSANVPGNVPDEVSDKAPDEVPDGVGVEGDPYRLQQLLRNLIDNASQHGRAGGDIDVELLPRQGRVLLRVANDGDPIPDDEVARIFEPYYRLQAGAASGAGLGLSIVREIANQHKAELSVGRKPDGQGCVVTVTFPAA